MSPNEDNFTIRIFILEIYEITKPSLLDASQGTLIILVGERNYNKCFS
jgi:hypothetical protein